MAWERTWRGRRKKGLPNSLNSRPVISFKSNLSPETLGYIKKLALQKSKSRFINKAIEMRYFYETHKRGFLVQMIQNNYGFCKHLLRQIGRTFSITTK